MKDALATTELPIMNGGCTRNANSFLSISGTAPWGTLQYSSMPPKGPYAPHCRLAVNLGVRNVGSAVLCTWSLRDPYRNSLFSGANTGKSRLTATWIHALTDASRKPLPTRPYTSNMDYARRLLVLDITIR